MRENLTINLYEFICRWSEKNNCGISNSMRGEEQGEERKELKKVKFEGWQIRQIESKLLFTCPIPNSNCVARLFKAQKKKKNFSVNTNQGLT